MALRRLRRRLLWGAGRPETARRAAELRPAVSARVEAPGETRPIRGLPRRRPVTRRERYGMARFGQSCLAARRLREAGGKFGTVCWDAYGLLTTGWATRVHRRSRLGEELGPGLDQAFATLLEDLAGRGML